MTSEPQTAEAKAKVAAAARENLAEKLSILAVVLAQVGEVMTMAAAELSQAIEQEQAATMGYIAELEARLSQQRTLS